MNLDNQLKEVEFDWYCERCKYSEQDENKDPCDECLACGMREGSAKPLYFEDKDLF